MCVTKKPSYLLMKVEKVIWINILLYNEVCLRTQHFTFPIANPSLADLIPEATDKC